MAARGQDGAGERRRSAPVHARGQDDRPALGRSLPRRRDLPDPRGRARAPLPGRALRALRRVRLHPRPRRAAGASPSCRPAAGAARWTRSSRGWPAEGAARPPCCGPARWPSGPACRRRRSCARASSARRPPPRPGSACPNLPTALVPGHVDVQSAEELRRNVAAVTVDAVIRNLTEAPPRAARRGRRARPRRHRLRGHLRRGQSLLLRERVERRPADRAADSRARRRVPPLPRPARRDGARRAPARPAQRHRVERGGQRRDGRLPAGVHADPGRPRRGHGRPALRRRAQRQHAGRGDADHPERAAHQGARLQLRAGRAARRRPRQHHHRAVLAALPAQRRRASSTTRPTRAPSATRGAWCWPRTRT